MKTTRKGAVELNISPAALRAHIREGQIQPPQRRPGTAYPWAGDEIAAARHALQLPGHRHVIQTLSTSYIWRFPAPVRKGGRR